MDNKGGGKNLPEKTVHAAIKNHEVTMSARKNSQ